jgi:putative drug exporter of the RND superfamily
MLPALLSLLGPRIDRFQVLPRSRSVTRFWERLAHGVMRHPILAGVPALALLLALGLPFLHVQLSSPDASILPHSVASRQAFDVLTTAFAPGETAPIEVAIRMPGNVLDAPNLGRFFTFTHAITADPRVARVDSIVTIDPRITLAQYEIIYADPARIPDYFAASTLHATVHGDTAVVRVYSSYPSTSEESQALVQQIRDLTLGPGSTVLVDGVTAEIHDVVHELYHDFPHALLFIVLTTYAVLFILFRSVVLPLKAIVMNTLSIVASYGALVFVFQDGHFSGLLGFSPLGYVEASLPILMFCTLFGLSMDYEVFLLSRIKEAYDATGDNRRSVAEGMRQSGRIITSAALIVVVVSTSFMAADIVLIKALGLGVALAVLLDASVVRALLVPATMCLLGRWNWWVPAPLAARLPTSRRRPALEAERGS